MRKRCLKYIVLFSAVAVLVACGSRRAAAPTGRYSREPIREVTQEQIDADSKLIDALSLHESGRTDEALEAYARLAAADPRCAAAWYEMSRLALSRGWTDSARACIERAVAVDGSNRWYLLMQAEVYGRQGDGRGLARTWERIVDVDPERLENYYELSNARIAAGDLDGAVEALNRVERRVGVTEEVSLQKQRLWLAAGKEDKAERELVALAAALPHEKRYQAMLAEMYMSRGKTAKAKQYYDRVLAADPDDEYIHVQLAEYYKRTGHPDQADRELERAFANPRLDCSTKVQLMASFYSNEEFYTTRSATTFRLLEQVMRTCDDSAQYALVYGDVLMRQGRYAEAARWLELSLQRDSSRYEVWEGLLVCLTEVDEREADMVAYAARAERLFPMKTLPLYLQALYAYNQDRYADAAQKLDRILKWGFHNGYLEAESHALAAECYYRTGQYDKAWRAFDRFLELKPDDWGMMNNYAYYMAEQGVQLDKAERLSRRTIEAEPEQANSLDTYGWILHLLGRDAEARPYLERAVKLDPQSETLRRHLDQVKGQ